MMKTANLALFLGVLCLFQDGRAVEADGTDSDQLRVKREKKEPDIVPVDYFEKFGYLDEKEAGTQHDEQSLINAISEFQRMAGLKETGQLNKKTIAKMLAPRCGLPDVIRPGDRIAPRRQQDRNKPLQFNAPGYKWDKNDITYKFVGFSRQKQISQSSQKRAIRNALAKWSAITPLTFRETTSANADILIDWTWRDHRDGSPFDGRGGTLAHAFFPGNSPISGDTHFDEEELWTENTEDGTNLEIVAAHEFGHALGLGHSATRGALMQPFYGGYDANYKLHSDDIRGIQTLYGSKPRQNPQPRVTTRRPQPRPNPRPDPRPNPKPRPPPEDKCSLKFDAITTGPDGRLYAFRGRKVYKFNSNGLGIERGFPKSARHVFPKAPKNIGSAVYDQWRRRVYIFKSSKVWRYTNFRLDQGFPKRLKKGFYRRSQAATQNSRGEIILLKGEMASVWREDFEQPPIGYPIHINNMWIGLRSDLEAAITYNGYDYFFKGANYFKYSRRTRRLVYRKAKAGPWLGCGRVEPK